MTVCSQDRERFAVIGTGMFVSVVDCADPDTDAVTWALFVGSINAPENQPGVFLGEYASESRARGILKDLAEGMNGSRVMYMPRDDSRKDPANPADKLRQEPLDLEESRD